MLISDGNGETSGLDAGPAPNPGQGQAGPIPGPPGPVPGPPGPAGRAGRAAARAAARQQAAPPAAQGRPPAAAQGGPPAPPAAAAPSHDDRIPLSQGVRIATRYVHVMIRETGKEHF